MGGTSPVTRVLLLVAFLAALALRVGYFQVFNTQAKDLPTTRPASSGEQGLRRTIWDKEGFYGVVAYNLAVSGRFAGWAPLSGREPWEGSPPGTAFVAPAYPYLLAAVYKLAGPDNFRAGVVTLYWVQAMIGALGTILVFYLARRVFRSTFVGWLAWFAAAISYFLVTAVVRVEPVVLAATLITASVLAIVSAADKGTFWRHLFAGVLTGLAVLTVPAYLVVLPFAYLWTLTYGEGSAGRRFALSLVCVVAFALVLAPWTFRNYLVFRRLVPITDSFGYHFWIGNNPKANGGDWLGAQRLLDAALKPEERQRYEAIGHEVDRYRAMCADALRWARANPFRCLQLRLHTYAFFWFGQNVWLEHRIAYEHPLVLPVTILLFMLVLIGVGVRKSEVQRSRAWMPYMVLLLYPIPYTLTHVKALPLHRLPLDPLLLVLAAYAVASFLTGGRIGRARSGGPLER